MSDSIASYLIVFGNLAIYQVADDHSQPKCNQSQQTLSTCLDFFGRLLVYIYLAGNKEKVIADAMQNDSRIKHSYPGAVVSKRKQKIPTNPCEYPYQKHLLDTQPYEKERH